MEEQKELKDLTIVELKAAAYERFKMVTQFNAELQAIEQEIAKRFDSQRKAEKVKK